MKNFFGTFLAKKKRYQPIEPDEILLDSANLPKFDTARLEGRIERPLAARTFRTFLALSLCVGIVALGQLVYLQIFRYEALSARAEENRLAHSIIIAERGLILDRKWFPVAPCVCRRCATILSHHSMRVSRKLSTMR